MKTAFLFFYRNKKRTTWMALAWTLMILVACLIPGRDVPEVDVPLADKWVHFGIFGGFSFLWMSSSKKTTICRGIAIGLLSVLLGYTVELLQGSGITQGRSYDLYDLLADSIGGLLGLILFFLLRSYAGQTT